MARTCTRRPERPATDQPRLVNGTVDVRALLAEWDHDANLGAGKPRTGER